MDSFLAMEWVIGIAVACLLIGSGVSWLVLNAKGASRTRVRELEASLESAQEEMSDYKREVYGQFSETAEKFRALDKSYHELHRQLATSSVALLGDRDMPLLLNETPLAEPSREEIVVDEATEDASGADNAPPVETTGSQATDVEVADVGEEIVDDIVAPEIEPEVGDEVAPDIESGEAQADRQDALDQAKSAG